MGEFEMKSHNDEKVYRNVVSSGKGTGNTNQYNTRDRSS